ncbi:MAG: oligosaccharide flippase family protein [Planctomycetota bacterium]
MSQAPASPLDLEASELSDALDTPTTEVTPPDMASGQGEKDVIKKKAMLGGLWTVGAYGFSQSVRFGSNIVLAWVIAPEIFGLMGLVTIVLAGLQMFSDIGIGPAIIQNKREDDAFVNTAFTMQALRGFVLWGAAALLAWPLSQVLDPQLAIVLPIVSVQAMILGFQSTNWFTANRNLAVKWMMLVDLSAIAVQSAVMISYAYLIEASVWALVAGVIAYALVRGAGSHFLPGTKNRFGWDVAAAASLFHFGKWLFFSTVLTFSAAYFDKLLLRNWTTAATFGVFWVGYQLANLGPELAFKLGSMVGFPALAEVFRTRPHDLNKELHRVRKVLLLPVTGILLCLMLFGPALFYMVYKPSFWGAGWIVQALAINSLAGQLNTTYSHAYIASGKTLYNLITVAAQTIIVFASVTLGYTLGPYLGVDPDTGFILGLAGSQFAKYPVDAILCSRIGVHQWKWDLKLLACSTALSIGLLALSLAVTPLTIDLGIALHVWFDQITASWNGGTP